MQSRDFCYWLQGFFEISDESKGLSGIQVEKIKAHLNMVFEHEIDPSLGSKNHVDDLKKIHASRPGINPKNIDPSDIKYTC